MTVNAANTHEFSINRLVHMAYRRCVLIAPGQELSTVQLTEGTDALELTMRDLDARGVALRSVRYDTIQFTADDEYLTLEEDVFDVGHTAMCLPASTTDTTRASDESPVERVYRDDMHEISDKSATGNVPTMFWLDKSETPYRIKVWPIPNEAGYLRLEVTRLAANSTDASKTPDRERHFANTLVFGISHKLAMSNGVSLDRVMMFRQGFEDGVAQCLGREKEVVDRQFKMGHRSGYMTRYR